MDSFGRFRSNYFVVHPKRGEAFRTWCEQQQIEIATKPGSARLGIYNTGDTIPWEREEKNALEVEGEEALDVEASFPKAFDFLAELATFLNDGEVAVLMEISYEPHYRERIDTSIGGYAYAVNSNGEKEQMSLAKIYEKARRLGQVHGRCDY